MNPIPTLAYHGDPACYRKYKSRVDAHRAADHLVQGKGWISNGSTKGCAVGCIGNAYDHRSVAEQIGYPIDLVYLCDSIHEGLPKSDALPVGEERLAWVQRFIRAGRPVKGKYRDLSLVAAQVAVWCLTDAKWGSTALPDQPREALDCCRRVSALWQRVIDGESQEALRQDFLREGDLAGAWARAGAGAGAGDFWRALADKLIELIESAPLVESTS